MAARKTAHVTEVPSPRSTRIITCANHKGGTGKTTTAVNVSAGLAVLTQQRVLLVDCDPRGHASLALGIDIEHVRYSVTDLLTGALPEVQALSWDPGTNLHILPANATLTDLEPELWRRGEGAVSRSNTPPSTPSWTPSMSW
jgi:chromosome partitioning protein